MESGQDNDQAGWQFKPGETISPRTAEAAPATVPTPTPTETTPAEPVPTAPLPPAEPTPEQLSAQPVVTEQPTPAEPAPQPIAPDPTALPDEPDMPADEDISWQASEYIDHDKSAGWHLLLIVGAIVVAVAIWFIFRDIVTPIVVVLAAIGLSVYGARKPQQLSYQLGRNGITIGMRQYAYADFKAYSIVPEGAFATIVLLPSKRFAPLTTLYFDPQDGERIVDVLSLHLPHQERRPDAIDSLMDKIHF